jgi:hypothetical protein
VPVSKDTIDLHRIPQRDTGHNLHNLSFFGRASSSSCPWSIKMISLSEASTFETIWVESRMMRLPAWSALMSRKSHKGRVDSYSNTYCWELQQIEQVYVSILD